MKEFRVNKKTSIICRNENTRYGFRHLATLMINGQEVDKANCCYYNRTWESYEYETVIRKLLRKTTYLTQRQKSIFLSKGKRKSKEELKRTLQLTSTIAKMGEIFCDTKEEKNNWKQRMLNAGLNISTPSDWNTLSEDEKEKRLNSAIAEGLK